MPLKLKIFGLISLFTLILYGCASSKLKGDLPTFILNGKTRNDLVVNRTPDYGISNRDGCVILSEFSLRLTINKNDSIYGLLSDSKTNIVIPFALVYLKFDSDSDTLFLTTDNIGYFKTKSQTKIESLEVKYIGYRTLRVKMQ